MVFLGKCVTHFLFLMRLNSMNTEMSIYMYYRSGFLLAIMYYVTYALYFKALYNIISVEYSRQQKDEDAGVS